MGEVEAVDPGTTSYRIRFDRPGLGTHTVPDHNVQVSKVCAQLLTHMTVSLLNSIMLINNVTLSPVCIVGGVCSWCSV